MYKRFVLLLFSFIDTQDKVIIFLMKRVASSLIINAKLYRIVYYWVFCVDCLNLHPEN